MVKKKTDDISNLEENLDLKDVSQEDDSSKKESTSKDETNEENNSSNQQESISDLEIDEEDLSEKSSKNPMSGMVLAIDNKTNPKAGKTLYKFFKWATILIFVLAIPLFMIVFSMTNLDEIYTFKGIISEQVGSQYKEKEITEVFDYDDIETSIEDIYDGDLVIKADNIFLTQESETGTYIFYSLFAGEFEINDLNQVEIMNSDGTTTWISYLDYDENQQDVAIFNEYLDKPSFSRWITSISTEYDDPTSITSEQAIETFKIVFPSSSGMLTENADEISKLGNIIGWSLIGLGILFSLGWMWFSKFSNVSLKKDSSEENKEEE